MKPTAQKHIETSRTSDFPKIAKNLYRPESSGRHYAFIKKSGKQFRRSLRLGRAGSSRLCDLLDFLMMDLAFDEWKAGQSKQGYEKVFAEWRRQDLTAMLHRDRNHPIAW